VLAALKGHSMDGMGCRLAVLKIASVVLDTPLLLSGGPGHPHNGA
jgi:hypothetical protein